MVTSAPALRRWAIGGAAIIAALLFSPGLIAAAPEDQDARIDAWMAANTAPGRYPGMVALVWHGDRMLVHRAIGYRDIARTQPMREDAIFRIYSMTKPVASVALLQLLEQGRVSLDDPVSRYLPGFDSPMLVAGGTEDAPVLARSPSAPTLRNLLTHTSGLSEDTQAHPVAAALLAHAGLDDATSLEDAARRLASVPLAEAPGTHFHYAGANTELVSRVVEVVSGKRFADVLAERIFVPLRMRDTGFEVPSSQRGRVVDLTTTSAEGRLVVADTASARQPGTRLRARDSGAGGLYSTAPDYLRFSRMLANGGELDGARVLGRKTVELMRQDQLGAFDPPLRGPSRGEGFGLGVGVVVDVAARGRPGSAGQYGWPGAASTWFTVDPQEHVVAILMAQYLRSGDLAHDLPSLSAPFQALVYGSLP